MNISKRQIPIKTGQKINIYHLTDTHDGADGCDSKLLKDVIRKIELDKNGYWLHGGDIIDPDRPSQRVRKTSTTHDRPEVLSHEDEKSMLWLEKFMFPKWEPIAHKCLGIVAGDHFIEYGNRSNSAEHLCQRLKMPYLGERLGYSSINFSDGKGHMMWYDMLIRHGKGTASTSGGDVASLDRQSTQWFADAHFGGHTHQENCHPIPFMKPSSARSKLQERISWRIRGGSFLRGYLPGRTTYVEKAEYNPLCVGWAELHLTIRVSHCGELVISEQSAEIHAA